MPELAEVFFNASHWKAAQGESFDFAWMHEKTRCCRLIDGRELESRFEKLTLSGGYTHGKRMLFAFRQGGFLEVHLGMTGSLLRADSNYEEERYDHFALRSPHSTLVFRDPRQFGKVAWHSSREEALPDWWSSLPPEPQSEAFTFERFESMLERRSGSLLKPLLLQQALFPGVGNWMADEILWRARLRPDRRLTSLDDVERRQLYCKTKWVCERALEIIGKDYSDPPKSWLFQHRWKDGGICPVSKKELRRETIGGRTSCWSPAVQV